jgi:hypothetical protein
MIRFPMRTLVLMALALLSFGWMWLQTHRVPARLAPMRATLLEVEASPPAGGDR